MVGAPGHDYYPDRDPLICSWLGCPVREDQGAAYIFAPGPDTMTWGQQQKLSEGWSHDNFGSSVAIRRNMSFNTVTADTVVVGAPGRPVRKRSIPPPRSTPAAGYPAATERRMSSASFSERERQTLSEVW